MHPMLREILHAHRLERARANMQRQRRALHAASVESGKERRVEVQACRGRRDRAGISCIDRLVAGFIEGIGIVFDIRRQRQAAILLDQRQAIGRKMQRVERLHALADSDFEGIGEKGVAAPPRACWPRNRAFRTLVSLNTSRSPGSSRPGNSVKWRSVKEAVAARLSTSSKRLALRSVSAVCAISSGGRLKSKSESVNMGKAGRCAMMRACFWTK